jgi:hypothetical protein
MARMVQYASAGLACLKSPDATKVFESNLCFERAGQLGSGAGTGRYGEIELTAACLIDQKLTSLRGFMRQNSKIETMPLAHHRVERADGPKGNA